MAQFFKVLVAGLVMAMLWPGVSGTVAKAASTDYPIAVRHLTYVDESRSVKVSSGFAGATVRRLDVTVWYPIDNDRLPVADAAPPAHHARFPLVIYSHGTFGRADNATHLTTYLAKRGYIVLAPDYPLSSSNAYTKIRFADISDVAEQTRDIRFLIDKMLADPVFGPAIDPQRIGTTGHSLGGVTSYFASFGLQTRDPRIRATAMIGAGDPVQSALASDMGLFGIGHSATSVPALFLSAEKDVFARTTGLPHAAFERVSGPKFEVLISGGVHVWFRDGAERLTDNKNPDCLFFERWMPSVTMPGCEERLPLIGPEMQQTITRAAIGSFFDAYLKENAAEKRRLSRLNREFAQVDVRWSE